MIIKVGGTDILIKTDSNEYVFSDKVLTKIAPGQQDTIILQLGINLVRIEYRDGKWRMVHNQNVASEKSKTLMISMESIIKE